MVLSMFKKMASTGHYIEISNGDDEQFHDVFTTIPLPKNSEFICIQSDDEFNEIVSNLIL